MSLRHSPYKAKAIPRDELTSLFIDIPNFICTRYFELIVTWLDARRNRLDTRFVPDWFLPSCPSFSPWGLVCPTALSQTSSWSFTKKHSCFLSTLLICAVLKRRSLCLTAYLIPVAPQNLLCSGTAQLKAPIKRETYLRHNIHRRLFRRCIPRYLTDQI